MRVVWAVASLSTIEARRMQHSAKRVESVVVLSGNNFHMQT